MADRIIPPLQSVLVDLETKRPRRLSEEERYKVHEEFGRQFAGNHLRVREQLEAKIRRGEVPEYDCREQLRQIERVSTWLKARQARHEQRLKEESARLFGNFDQEAKGPHANLASRLITSLKRFLDLVDI